MLSDGRCEGVLVLDVKGLSTVTDYIVIASGTSERQIRTSVDDLKDLGRELGHAIYRHDGTDEGAWVVVDFVDVVVHVLTPEQRVYYDLEALWGDAPRLTWQESTEAGQFARIGAGRSGIFGPERS